MEYQKKPLKVRIKLAAELYRIYFKIGCCTFGGGIPIIAQIQKEFIEKRSMLTETELLDLTSVGRSLPGLMVANVSYLFGYHVAGFLGAFSCVFGFVTPPLLILILITEGYTSIRDNMYVARAMTGVRAAVVPIILSAAVGLRKSALAKRSGYLFLLLAFVLYAFLGVNSALIVVICGSLGVLLSGLAKKGGEQNAA